MYRVIGFHRSHSQISCPNFSQKGLLAFSTGRTTVIINPKGGFRPCHGNNGREVRNFQKATYLKHIVDRSIVSSLKFCPYDDPARRALYRKHAQSTDRTGREGGGGEVGTEIGDEKQEEGIQRSDNQTVPQIPPHEEAACGAGADEEEHQNEETRRGQQADNQIQRRQKESGRTARPLQKEGQGGRCIEHFGEIYQIQRAAIWWSHQKGVAKKD